MWQGEESLPDGDEVMGAMDLEQGEVKSDTHAGGDGD